MPCFICAVKFSGFIGSKCACEDSPPEGAVTDQDEIVTVDGVPVTHNGE